METTSFDTQKATFKVIKPLYEKLAERLELTCFKRDLFLNKLLLSEMHHAQNELSGVVLEPRDKRLISSKLSEHDLVMINVVLDKQTAELLNKVVKEKNLVRDALINRIIYFLTCPAYLESELGIPEFVDETIVRDFINAVPTCPFELLSMTLSDPLFFIRETLKKKTEHGLYDFNMNPFELNALSCYPPQRADDVLKLL